MILIMHCETNMEIVKITEKPAINYETEGE